MPATPSHLRDGSRAEARACDHLIAAGLRLVARNYRSPFGEIDLLMHEGETLVFIEVRYRKQTDYGGAAASITSTKQSRLRATAEHYLQHNQKWSRSPCRFDVITISGDVDHGTLDWYPNAF